MLFVIICFLPLFGLWLVKIYLGVTSLYWTRGLHRVEERIVDDKTLVYKPINSYLELSTFSYFTLY